MWIPLLAGEPGGNSWQANHSTPSREDVVATAWCYGSHLRPSSVSTFSFDFSSDPVRKPKMTDTGRNQSSLNLWCSWDSRSLPKSPSSLKVKTCSCGSVGNIYSATINWNLISEILNRRHSSNYILVNTRLSDVTVVHNYLLMLLEQLTQLHLDYLYTILFRCADSPRTRAVGASWRNNCNQTEAAEPGCGVRSINRSSQ